ncbi:MAG TPA: hypothetical protein DIC18_04440 [Clostridiales bacterium]|nr:hypothetical protein [Clostridiales bacterium]
MNCLLVINTLSGNASKVREEKLIEKYAEGCAVTVKYIRDREDTYTVDGVDRLIVCGGDGTLNHALNICRDKELDIYYLPFGTFNETAKGMQGSGVCSLAKMGRIKNVDFAYVAAAGSFTDIGQSPSAKLKRRFKIFAYFSKVLASYKVHRIPAKIECDTFSLQDTYTLVMFSNAKRCFGFRFNRLHRDNSDDLQLLLIKAPKKDNLWGRICMFFPFFRAFFMGFGKEHRGKRITFVSIKNATLTLANETPFCVDGELKRLVGELPVSKQAHKARIYLIKE